jgi:hypothetical protein
MLYIIFFLQVDRFYEHCTVFFIAVIVPFCRYGQVMHYLLSILYSGHRLCSQVLVCCVSVIFAYTSEIVLCGIFAKPLCAN